MFSIRHGREFAHVAKLFPIAAQFQRAAVFFIWGRTMSKVCQVTGKGPITGNNVSHAKTTLVVVFA